MVKPYLSRLRPAEPGPRLRPRPRSRFEPAPLLPIDGPAIGSHRPGVPPTVPAEATDVEIEVGPDAPYQDLAAPPAATPGDEAIQQVQATARQPTPQDEARAPAPARARAAAKPPLRDPALAAAPAGDTGPDPDSAGSYLAVPLTTAPGDRAVPQVWTTARRLTPQDEARAPARARAAQPPLRDPAPAAAPVDETRPLMSAGNEEDLRLVPAEAANRKHASAPRSATRRAAPQPRHAPPDQAPVLSDRASSGWQPGADPTPPEPAPGERPSPAPRRRVNWPSGDADARAGGVQGGSVQAIAPWLGDANAAARAETTAGLLISPQPALAPRSRIPGWPSPAAVHTDVTVTIGRIEVKAPAPDPAPPRPQPSGPRQRVPSLSAYLESRTRARGG